MKLDLRLGPAGHEGLASPAPVGAARCALRSTSPARPAPWPPVPTAPALVAGAVPVLRSVVSDTPAGAGLDPLHRTPAAGHPSAHVPAADTWYTVRWSNEGLLVIPRGVHLVGDCRACFILVEGRVDGRLCAQGGVIVAEGGQALGGIEAAGSVVVAGRVRAGWNGVAIVARGRLALAGTARVTGDVDCDDLLAYRGARVKGRRLGR